MKYSTIKSNHPKNQMLKAPLAGSKSLPLSRVFQLATQERSLTLKDNASNSHTVALFCEDMTDTHIGKHPPVNSQDLLVTAKSQYRITFNPFFYVLQSLHKSYNKNTIQRCIIQLLHNVKLGFTISPIRKQSGGAFLFVGGCL